MLNAVITIVSVVQRQVSRYSRAIISLITVCQHGDLFPEVTTCFQVPQYLGFDEPWKRKSTDVDRLLARPRLEIKWKELLNEALETGSEELANDASILI